ncbi:MAG: MBL fold metallo-hydrolase [Ruminococcus sp.]|nr:MBL fold metallo-hydrolase [Ruminococcus sp.]MCM1382811.1 MBL fold metallo-hydrolase [Muribaculaceae bacterium]MCM1480848.1 MBL fold metallo-hydrolase [Muribaculaceae bacterium]
MNLEGVNMITCGAENCYVIQGESGDMLIDTGTEEDRDTIETWLGYFNVKVIFLTHGHNDHIGNAAYLAERFGAEIAMSKFDAALSRHNLLHRVHCMGLRGNVIWKASRENFESFSDPFKVDILLEDGMPVGEKYGIDCKAVKLDGHTKGSFGVMQGGDLYVGDALMNFVIPSSSLICESPKAAKETLYKIAALSPERIFFGHGKPIEAGSRAYSRLLNI